MPTPDQDISAKPVEVDKIQRKSKSRKSKKRKVRKSKNPSQNITSTDVVDIEISTGSAQVVLDINQTDTIQNKDDLTQLPVVDSNIQEPVADINHLDQHVLQEDNHTKPPFDKAPGTDIERTRDQADKECVQQEPNDEQPTKSSNPIDLEDTSLISDELIISGSLNNTNIYRHQKNNLDNVNGNDEQTDKQDVEISASEPAVTGNYSTDISTIEKKRVKRRKSERVAPKIIDIDTKADTPDLNVSNLELEIDESDTNSALEKDPDFISAEKSKAKSKDVDSDNPMGNDIKKILPGDEDSSMLKYL